MCFPSTPIRFHQVPIDIGTTKVGIILHYTGHFFLTNHFEVFARGKVKHDYFDREFSRNRRWLSGWPYPGIYFASPKPLRMPLLHTHTHTSYGVNQSSTSTRNYIHSHAHTNAYIQTHIPMLQGHTLYFSAWHCLLRFAGERLVIIHIHQTRELPERSLGNKCSTHFPFSWTLRRI